MPNAAMDNDSCCDGSSNNDIKRRETNSAHPKGTINEPVPDAEVISAPQPTIAELARDGNFAGMKLPGTPLGYPTGSQLYRMQNPSVLFNEATATMGMQQYVTPVFGQLQKEQYQTQQQAPFEQVLKNQDVASEREKAELEQSTNNTASNKTGTTTEPSQENDCHASSTEQQQQPLNTPTVPPPTSVTTQTIQQYLVKMQDELQRSQSQYQEQIKNQYAVLQNDLQHLEKKCVFLEKKCDMYQRRQRKMEKLFFMRKSSKRKSIGGDDGDNDAESNSQHRNGDDISIDEDAAEEFFGGDDEVEIQSDESIDGANDDDTDGSEEKKSKPKRRRRRKTKSDYEGSIVPDHIVHSPSELNFETMFDKLRQFQQQHGTCSVPKEYDSQLHTWVGHWKSRRKQFEEMVAEEGGPDVVFPGLGDIDDKSLGKDLPEYDYEWENERVKHIEPSTRSKAQNRRRYLLRTRYRIQRLNTLGFVWAIKKQPKFEDRLVQLQAYIDEFGHYNVPREYGDLGEWFHKVKGKFVFQTKLFMEKQYPKLLEMGVDMSVAVEGRRRRRRKKKSDVTNISEGAGGTRTDGDVSLES
mmetsp:Transcript_19382/g.38887  ORF Transcript_19382/g.38887 Transcript_19382/m.38887 type:complete len:580 (-) Transcript_19382:45-1784(-)